MYGVLYEAHIFYFTSEGENEEEIKSLLKALKYKTPI
jgi:hypothetical protein